jgi:hypothetical protein
MNTQQATTTQRFSGSVVNAANVPQEDTAYCGSCTFLNMTGDITIAWDAHNRERMLEVIRKKMDEGYTFFTIKKFLFGTISRKSAVTKRDLSRGKMEEIIVSDEQFDKMVADMNDSDVADLVRSEKAVLAKRHGRKDLVALARAQRAEDVLDKDSVALRPLRGG